MYGVHGLVIGVLLIVVAAVIIYRSTRNIRSDHEDRE